jgi:aminoglycoside phosphotransferase (APT) family kinase protein
VLDDGHGAEIARRYSLGDEAVLVGPVARGHQGEVWELTTGGGRWAVKRLFCPTSEEAVGEDAAFQAAAYAAGVPTPEVRRTVGGDVLMEIAGLQVRVYGWRDLNDPSPDLDPVAVGATVAALHRVGFAGTNPVDPWYTDPVGASRWDELLRDLAAAGAPFATRLAALRHDLVALEAVLAPPGNLQTCHRDLWADNLRSTAGGAPCVIDWQDCGLADPAQELALVLFEFCYRDGQRARLLHAAYVDAGGPARVRRRCDFSMVVAQLGHINEIACRRWLRPAATEADRSLNEGRVAEVITKPLTLGIVDELLDSLA